MARQSKVTDPKPLHLTPAQVEKLSTREMVARWAKATGQKSETAERELVTQGFARKVAIATAARKASKPAKKSTRRTASRKAA